GEVSTIGFPLENSDPHAVVVERIEVKVAHCGLGRAWEEEARSAHFTCLRIPLSPRRCCSGRPQSAGMNPPLVVGRNLHVFESQAGEEDCKLLCRLGNPTRVGAPIVLHLDGSRPAGTSHRSTGPSGWSPARSWRALVLHALPQVMLDHVRTLEATV